MPFLCDYIPNQYKAQEMYNSIISEDPFSVRYVPYNKCVIKLLMIVWQH